MLRLLAITDNSTATEAAVRKRCYSKKRLQHRCFPVNIAKYLRTALL